MARTPEDDAREGEAAALFDALRADAVQAALDGLEADTGLAREQVIAESVVFAQVERRAFLAYLRRRGQHADPATVSSRPAPGFLRENGIEILVGGMFLLGVALAATEMLMR